MSPGTLNAAVLILIKAMEMMIHVKLNLKCKFRKATAGTVPDKVQINEKHSTLSP